MNKFSLLLIYIFLVQITNANGQKAYHDKEAVRLNDAALMIVLKNSSVKDSVEKAILIYAKAISIDSTLGSAYFNKANAECSINLIQQAINTMDDFLLIKPNSLSAILLQAILLEKMGRWAESKKKYQRGFKTYHEQMAKNPYSSNRASSYIFTVFLRDGKEAAIKEYDKIRLTLKAPDPILDSTLEGIKGVSREEAVDGFCGTKMK